MKRFLSILAFILFILTCDVYASASFSVSTPNNQIARNSTFNITLSGSSVGRVDIKVENGTCSASSLWYEEKTQSITCRAGNKGTVRVTVTPQRGFSDSDGNIYSPGVKVLNLEIKETETTTAKTNTTTKKATTISTTKKLEVNTVKTSSNVKTTTKTTTTKNRNEVTESTSSSKDESKKSVLTYNNKEIHLSKNELDSSLETNDMLITDIKIDNISYPALKIKDNYLLKSDDGNYYVYDNKESKFINEVKLINIGNRHFFVDNSLDNTTVVTIGNTTVMGEKLADRYYKIKALNNEGKFVFYIYETTEGSMQLYEDSLFTCNNEKEKTIDNINWYITGIGFIFFIIGLLIFVYVKVWRK